MAHAIISLAHLSSSRVDRYILEYPGVTHLLDVYSGRRIDKRSIFKSPYSGISTLV